MSNSKDSIAGVFDQLASTRSWENLYSGELNRMSYNFVSRQRAVEELLEPHASGKALDIGCGSGDLVRFYTDRGVRYEGVDLSPNMIDRARENYAGLLREGKASFGVADCENLPYEDGAFDMVSAVALIEYLPDSSKALDEMLRVVKPKGFVLVTVPSKRCVNTWIRKGVSPFRSVFFPVYAKLRGAKLSAMRHVTHYNYSQDELDNLMEKRGCSKIGHRYTNFHIIPHPLDHLVPKLYIRISEGVVKRGRERTFQIFASNYIALYRKS